MKDKPHKWDYKLFVLCEDIRFAHKETYSGQENNPKIRHDCEPNSGAGGNVVIRLSREILRNQNYELYFGRYYTSLNLSVYLFKQGSSVLGQFRETEYQIANSEMIKNCQRNNVVIQRN